MDVNRFAGFWRCVTALFLFCTNFVQGRQVNTEMKDDMDIIARLYIGGSEVANISDAPFVAALMLKRDSELRTICTASIIGENWVLSAAHCVPFPADAFLIAAGSNSSEEIQHEFHKLNPHFSSYNGPIQIRDVKTIAQHPRYKMIDIFGALDNPDFLDFAGRFDLALCEVDSWSFGRTINKIALFDETWSGDTEPGEEYKILNCSSFGWGKTNSDLDDTSPYLRTSIFKIQHGTRACSCFKPYVNRRMLCTSSNENQHSVCPGDSGGPLVCKNKLAGVAHVGYIPRHCLFEPLFGGRRVYKYSPLDRKPDVKCGGKDVVSAWMYVCPVLEWIGEHVPDAPRQPLSCRSSPAPVFSPLMTAVLIVGLSADFPLFS